MRVCREPGCPVLSTRPACRVHQRALDTHARATTPTKATRTSAERARRAAAVRAWRSAYGDWCPGYGVPAHRSNDLTADHVVAVANGGAPDGRLAVCCRGCNARKGAR